MTKFTAVAAAVLAGMLVAPTATKAQDPAILGDNSRQAPNARRIWERPSNYSRNWNYGRGSNYWMTPVQAYEPDHWVPHEADSAYFGYFVNGVQVAGYNSTTDVYRTYDARTDTWSKPIAPPWGKRKTK